MPGEQRARVTGQRHLLGGQLGGGLAQPCGPSLGRLMVVAHVVREQRPSAGESEEQRVVRGRRQQQVRAVDPDPPLRHQDRPCLRIRTLLGEPLGPLALERSTIEDCTREEHDL